MIEGPELNSALRTNMELNSVNCVILTAVLALTLLSYLVICCVNLALGLGGLAPRL